ncbi:hypothetical protein F5146DRAFT_999457 [Armillaria mellea]|nr:hypothetical protein F5146DRAFT_999457 [Armillaria mellea]
MVTQTDIPSDHTDDENAYMLQFLDATLNSEILYALLYGIYTGIFAVSLWTIFINKCQTIRKTTVIITVLLYALISINFVVNWYWTQVAFIKNGQNLWTIASIFYGNDTATAWIMDITASISTILADSYMAWTTLYVICVILDLAFTINNDFKKVYLDSISGIAKGIAPTLLVGRAAAGHMLPRDDRDESLHHIPRQVLKVKNPPFRVQSLQWTLRLS